MKKLVIIGGGISGLTAGIYGRLADFEVEVYEKNPTPGGECTGWDREGFHIDNCVHWMMGTAPGTALHEIWKTTGALEPETEVLHFDRMYTSEQDGTQLTLWKDTSHTEQELLSLSPEDSGEIKKLMASVRLARTVAIPADKPAELMSGPDLLRLTLSSRNALRLFRRYAGMDTRDLAYRFRHPLIRCLLTDFCTPDSPASSFPMAYGNFAGGDGGIPRGGSRAMALRMQAKLEQLGGTFFPGMPALKIKTQGTKAVSLLLSDGQEVPADYIICACDPYVTFSRLLSPDYMDPVLREVYSHRKDYPVYGMFQAAYGVDCSINCLEGELILDCPGLPAASWINSRRITVKTYGYEPDFAPKGKQLLQVLLGLSEDAYSYWAELYKDRPAYITAKQALADTIQQRLEQRFPDYQGKLRLLDAWTPVTYQRWCNAFQGANQAFTISKGSRKNPYPAPWIKNLSNVLLSGQWLSPPGGLPGAAIQGKFAVQRILHQENRPFNF